MSISAYLLKRETQPYAYFKACTMNFKNDAKIKRLEAFLIVIYAVIFIENGNFSYFSLKMAHIYLSIEAKDLMLVSFQWFLIDL